MSNVETWERMGNPEASLSADEVARLRSLIGKPSSQATRAPVEDSLVEAVYRGGVHIRPGAAGPVSSCAHCGLESAIREGRVRHLGDCALAKLYIRAGGGKQIELAQGNAHTGFKYTPGEAAA